MIAMIQHCFLGGHAKEFMPTSVIQKTTKGVLNDDDGLVSIFESELFVRNRNCVTMTFNNVYSFYICSI